MKIWIDADAAPKEVKAIVFRAAKRLEISTVLVANQRLYVPLDNPHVRAERVQGGPDVADQHIADHASAGDVAVTADIPLADALVQKGVTVLDPRGEVYTEENVRERLSIRDFMDALRGSGVKVAAVSTYFPSGQAPLELKLADVRKAIELGADEVDMVIDRGEFLAGEYARVFDEIVAVKEACGETHLKVILETGELETYDNVRRASVLAMAAGADFIKTSTGKVTPAAQLPVALVMLEAIRDFYQQTGRAVGMKPAGSIRTAKEAIGYLTVLYETLGPDWMTPDRFRFGASSLLNDVLMQIRKERSGRYSGGDYFTLD